MVVTGLQRLLEDKSLQDGIKGNIAYLCHSPSVDKNIKHGVFGLQKIFGQRLVKLFGPQHGFVGDVQDNMIETNDFIHPYFKLTIHSLYSETRIPTDAMLKGVDTVLIDLQDVGTRIYTYIYTMTLMMKKCAELGIEVIILDRPNPINANDLEGNVLDMNFASFVGLHPLPVRHAMTIAEIALMANSLWQNPCKLKVIEMKNYDRKMSYEDCKIPWVIPSPNLPTIDAAYTFVGTVLFEGTNISEGRGTTRSLEIIGHPKIEPYSYLEKLEDVFKNANLMGFVLRPLIFLPTFQKHKGMNCGGFQIHVTDRNLFKPWRVCQILCREFYHHLGTQFSWKEPPYEYEYHKAPIDLVNGTDKLKIWVEKNGDHQYLDEIENEGLSEFKKLRSDYLIY